MPATFGLLLIAGLPLVGLGSYAYGWWWRGRYDRQRQLELEVAHGSALQAIEYAVEHAHPEGDEFLRAWRKGDLSEWPEYYEWLGRDGPVYESESVRPAQRGDTLLGVASDGTVVGYERQPGGALTPIAPGRLA